MKYPIVLLILTLLLTACQSEQGAESLVEPGVVSGMNEYDAKQAPPERRAEAPPSESELVKSMMLIKKGRLEFEVKSIQATYDKIKALVKDFEGYISKESQRQTSYRQNYFLEVRIPANNFDAFILSMDSGVDSYDNRSIEADDVGEEFYDLKIRLENKKKLLERYRQLLPQTKKMSEILQLERELQKVAGEIDRIEGRMRYLKDQTSFSTININFYKTVDESPQARKGRSFGARFIKNIQGGWLLIQDFFLGMVRLWPFVLLLGIAGWLFWRRRKRKGAS